MTDVYMRILVLLSMIAVVGFLSGCGGWDRLEVAEIRGDCPEEAIRAATLDSGWRNAGMTFRETMDEWNAYHGGAYESEEEFILNYGREGKVRSLRRIARTFKRNVDRHIPSCRSEVWVHQFTDSGHLTRKYRFLLERRNGKILACRPHTCFIRRDDGVAGCSVYYESWPESYDFCADTRGEIK